MDNAGSTLMESEEMRRIITNHAVQIAPTDDKAKGDTSLVNAFGIVRSPGDGIGNAGVNAESA